MSVLPASNLLAGLCVCLASSCFVQGRKEIVVKSVPRSVRSSDVDYNKTCTIEHFPAPLSQFQLFPLTTVQLTAVFVTMEPLAKKELQGTAEFFLK